MQKKVTEPDNLLDKTNMFGKVVDNVKWIDLVIERYKIKTAPKDNIYESLLAAASLGERVLYGDISGALQLDMIPLWGMGGEHQKYPNYKIKGEDVYAKWKCKKWMIPPIAYLEEFDWLPFDGMQKFQVKVTKIKKDNKYIGVLNIDAFVPDDSILLPRNRNKWRLGCLADIVNRNKKQIMLAQGTRLAVPFDESFKTNLEQTRIFKDYQGKLELPYFNLTNNQNKIKFKSINIEQRCKHCDYRDR